MSLMSALRKRKSRSSAVNKRKKRLVFKRDERGSVGKARVISYFAGKGRPGILSTYPPTTSFLSLQDFSRP